MQNVKFHDSVYTTPFIRMQTKSFVMVYLHDNWYSIWKIAYEDYPLFV